jgi:predicted nuclease with TOPRIM domain
MPPEISSEQDALLASWAAQRDAILLRISVAREEYNTLLASNTSLTDSNTDLENRALVIEGRIQELVKKEEEFKLLVSSETAALAAEKSGLQSDVANLRSEIVVLQTHKNTIKDMVNTLTDVYDRVFSRAEVLDKVVDHVTTISKDNIRDVEMLLGTLKSSVQGVIDINTENVAKTNNLIAEIPRAMFNMLRREPIQRPANPRPIQP